MGLLDDQLALDSFAFIDSEVFGESITYTPRVGSAVTMKRQLENLREHVGLDEPAVAKLTAKNPRRAIGL